MNKQIQSQLNQLYDTHASQYEGEAGHGIQEQAELEAWNADIFTAVAFPPGSRVLDVGAGTGVLSRILAERGCYVTGLDPAAGMIAEAQSRLPPALVGRLNFLVGDTHQPDLFSPGSFDWIVSRQVVGHFHDPLVAFQNWRGWLKARGGVMIIDGLWRRDGWGNDEALVDNLPLSCLQTRATVAYLLTVAGFVVEKNIWLQRVNAYFAQNEANSVKRYLITAKSG